MFWWLLEASSKLWSRLGDTISSCAAGDAILDKRLVEPNKKIVDLSVAIFRIFHAGILLFYFDVMIIHKGKVGAV
jgi:hypothetical protein